MIIVYCVIGFIALVAVFLIYDRLAEYQWFRKKLGGTWYLLQMSPGPQEKCDEGYQFWTRDKKWVDTMNVKTIKTETYDNR